MNNIMQNKKIDENIMNNITNLEQEDHNKKYNPREAINLTSNTRHLDLSENRSDRLGRNIRNLLYYYLLLYLKMKIHVLNFKLFLFNLHMKTKLYRKNYEVN